MKAQRDHDQVGNDFAPPSWCPLPTADLNARYLCGACGEPLVRGAPHPCPESAKRLDAARAEGRAEGAAIDARNLLSMAKQRNEALAAIDDVLGLDSRFPGGALPSNAHEFVAARVAAIREAARAEATAVERERIVRMLRERARAYAAASFETRFEARALDNAADAIEAGRDGGR